jgi:putative selenate reductase
VLVIGGGNTAMDAARTAQRLTHNPSTIVYRRTLAEMPAEQEELTWLFEEGNGLIELVSPVRVIPRNGRVVALECVRNELGEPGPDGRRTPVPVEGSEFQIEADSIILAIGQKPDLAFLDGTTVTFRHDGAIAIDDKTGQVTAQVYAGGDVTRGPDIIIGACADGRRAAEAICRQFGVEFRPPSIGMPELEPQDVLQVKRERARKEPQHEPSMLPVAERSGFTCVEQTLSGEAAQAEARRCLQCSSFCDKCVEVCPNRANYTYLVAPVRRSIPVLTCRKGKLMVANQETFAVTQTRQILHVDDFCNECGNCATFCVHQGKPYTEKPRLFLQRRNFELEDDNAFYAEGTAHTATIYRRERGQESQLKVQDGNLTFENAHIRTSLSPEFEIQEMALKEAFDDEFSLREAAEMAVILKGITASLPFLFAHG